MIDGFIKFYGALGTTKAQKFRRFFYILLLIAGVIVYGFHSDAINITLQKMVTQ